MATIFYSHPRQNKVFGYPISQLCRTFASEHRITWSRLDRVETLHCRLRHLRAGALVADVVMPQVHLLVGSGAHHTMVKPHERQVVHDLSPEKVCKNHDISRQWVTKANNKQKTGTKHARCFNATTKAKTKRGFGEAGAWRLNLNTVAGASRVWSQ